MTETATLTETPRPTPQMRPSCPCCGGVLVPLRGQVRCQRCQWAICAGCEGSSRDDDESAVNHR